MDSLREPLQETCCSWQLCIQVRTSFITLSCLGSRQIRMESLFDAFRCDRMRAVNSLPHSTTKEKSGLAQPILKITLSMLLDLCSASSDESRDCIAESVGSTSGFDEPEKNSFLRAYVQHRQARQPCSALSLALRNWDTDVCVDLDLPLPLA